MERRPKLWVRWARRRGLPRVAGHRAAIKAVREVVKGCASLGIDYLTLYTFSVENWKRPAREVGALMRFLRDTLKGEADADDDHWVSVKEIYDYVKTHVTRVSRRMGAEQTPIIMPSPDMLKDIAVSRVLR